LSRLNEKYEYWINNLYDGKLLIIDKDADDFVADPSIIDRICRQLDEMTAQK
jgi:deoxyadenosine/deoxycytidine kinase